MSSVKVEVALVLTPKIVDRNKHDVVFVDEADWTIEQTSVVFKGEGDNIKLTGAYAIG